LKKKSIQGLEKTPEIQDVNMLLKLINYNPITALCPNPQLWKTSF